MNVRMVDAAVETMREVDVLGLVVDAAEPPGKGDRFSDAIYETLTGEKGYFDTRIVFVDETGPKDRRVKRLAIMDQDGANVRYLTRGDELVLTPRFIADDAGNHLHVLRRRASRASICSTSRPASARSSAISRA